MTEFRKVILCETFSFDFEHYALAVIEMLNLIEIGSYLDRMNEISSYSKVYFEQVEVIN